MRAARVRTAAAITAAITLEALLALVPRSAAAYILPADAILASAAKRREQLGFTSLVVEGFRRRGNRDLAEELVWEAIVPGLGHRQEVRGPDGTTVVLTIGLKRWVFKEGERPVASKIRASLVSTFLMR